MSDRAFCEVIGVSSSYISSMRVSIQPDKLTSIAEQFPMLNIDWLLTGEGEMLKTLGNQEIKIAGKVEEPGAVYGQVRKEETLTTKDLIETIRFLSETVNSLQKKIEKLEAENKKINAQPEDNADFADVG